MLKYTKRLITWPNMSMWIGSAAPVTMAPSTARNIMRTSLHLAKRYCVDRGQEWHHIYGGTVELTSFQGATSFFFSGAFWPFFLLVEYWEVLTFVINDDFLTSSSSPSWRPAPPRHSLVRFRLLQASIYPRVSL